MSPYYTMMHQTAPFEVPIYLPLDEPRGSTEYADSVRLPGLLGLRSERRSDEAERENEPNQTNGHAPWITR